MTRAELIAAVQEHEFNCGLSQETRFAVAEVVELADGVLAVRDEEGDHTIYFDKTKCRMRVRSRFADEGLEIEDFPDDVGFITDMTAQNWPMIADTAIANLTGVRGKIAWHSEPVTIEY